MENLEKLSDQNLYHLCKTYGSRALEWRRKFIGLLPEVNRRKLFEKKGFESIFIFAKKLAGLSEEQVRLTLNLEKRFEKLPELKSLLINGEVSINKLTRITSIANSDNEEFLANQIQILSQGAVETLVRDEKWTRNKSITSITRNGLFEPENEDESLRAQTSKPITNLYKSDTLTLSPSVHQKLLELQQKGLDINQILLEFLQKRELEIAQKKEQISKKVLQKEEVRDKEAEILQEFSLASIKSQSRYIPKVARKIIHEEFGTKCSVKSCQKRAENIHHTLPFSLSKSNDPKFLVPLCKEHHELEHSINSKYQNSRKQWLRQT